MSEINVEKALEVIKRKWDKSCNNTHVLKWKFYSELKEVVEALATPRKAEDVPSGGVKAVREKENCDGFRDTLEKEQDGENLTIKDPMKFEKGIDKLEQEQPDEVEKLITIDSVKESLSILKSDIKKTINRLGNCLATIQNDLSQEKKEREGIKEEVCAKLYDFWSKIIVEHDFRPVELLTYRKEIIENILKLIKSIK